MGRRLLSGVVIVSFVLGSIPRLAEAAPERGKISKRVSGLRPVTRRASAFAETPSVREIIARMQGGGAADQSLVKNHEADEEINPLNSEWEPTPDPNAPPQFDGALQTYVRTPSVMPGPSLTFEGNSAADNTAVFGSTVAPPDTNGDVGPNDYVQTTNLLVRIWDKAGVPRGPGFRMSSLFAGVSGPCASGDQGDPIVLYDRLADRWLLSQFAFADQNLPPWFECVAISKTPDPTGPWYAYAFQTAATGFPDYPKLGVWSDGYYMTTREFNPSFLGHGAYALDRAKMLVGDPTAAYVYFHVPSTVSNASSGMVPTTFQGIEPPPAGVPNMFAIDNDDASGDPSDALRLFDFHADFVTPANSTFSERADSPLLVAAFNAFDPSGRADIEEPPPAVAADFVDSIGDRLMPRMQYIKRGTTESWTATQTVNAGTPGAPPTVAQYKAAPRYYELRRTSPAGAISVPEQATFSPDANERWMPSVAMDGQGDIAVGYSISSTSVFPSIAWAGRLVGDPPNGLAQGEATVFAGTGSQLGTGNRWGDYSAMSLDPSDSCSFWYTQQYQVASTPAGFDWHTRVGKFAFPGCTAPAQGTLSGTVTAIDTGLPLANSQVSVTGGPSNGVSTASLANGTYSMNLIPGTYTVTITNPDRNCSTVASFPGVVISNGLTTVQDAQLDGAAKFLISTTALSGNNGVINANDCTQFTVTLQNVGCHVASGVTGNLSTGTPNVVVVDPNTTYPNIDENATGTNSPNFQLSTAPGFSCGTPVDLSLAVSSANGSGTLPISLPTCAAAPTVITASLDGTEPLMNARLGRNGISSSCGSAKACPGPLGTGTRFFDEYSFTNTAPVPVCLNVNLAANCSVANQIMSEAYLGIFDPTNLCTNYLGDPGASPPNGGSNSFQVNLNSAQTSVVVVNNITAGQTCSSYTLTVSGFLDLAPGPGQCTGGGSGISIGDVTVTEGDSGNTAANFPVTLSPADPGGSHSVDFTTADGTATTANNDYLPLSGTVVFGPNETIKNVTISVVGDTNFEPDETFFVSLSNATGGVVIVDGQGVGTILNDDKPLAVSTRDELVHDSRETRDLDTISRFWRISQKSHSSYEVIVDAVTGDIVGAGGPELLRVDSDGATVLQTGTSASGGSSKSLRFENAGAGDNDVQFIRVHSTGCVADCDTSDTFRIRAFDTTYRMSRFNNSATQITVVLVANPTDQPVTGTLWFYQGTGALLASQAVSIPPKATFVLNTSTIAALQGQGGSATFSNDAAFGALAGKAVAVEPATGFTFDTPMVPRTATTKMVPRDN
jgi:hypothetical protein